MKTADTMTLTVGEFDAMKTRIRFLEEIIEEAIFSHNCGENSSVVVFRMSEALREYSESGKDSK